MIEKPRLQQKRGALLTMIGAGVSILAFLLLPYFIVTVTPLVIGNNSYQTTPISAYVQTITLGTGVVALFSGLIWLEVLLALVIFGVAALILLRETPFGSTHLPALGQVRQGAYLLLLLGVGAAAFQYFFVSTINSQITTLLETPLVNIPSTPNASVTIAALLSRSNLMVTITFGYGVGSWCYLAGMLLTLIGCALILRATSQPAVSVIMGAMSAMPPTSTSLLYPPRQDIAQMPPMPAMPPTPPAQPPRPLYSESWSQPLMSQGQPWQQPPSSNL